MTPRDLASRRLRNQRLVGAPFERLDDVVRWLGAVQSQDYAGAKWALAQRTTGADAAAVDRVFDEGAILRTHVLRPTWHFVRPADLRWMLALTAPRVKAVLAPYDRKLEIDGALLARVHPVLEGELRDGRHRTRTELAVALSAAGVAARGQRLGHLVMHAELDGLICSGPVRGKQHTYALLDERAPPALPLGRDEALAELARRYFTSHGPATPQDFAWWSGLTVADAKTGLALLGAGVSQETRGRRTYAWVDDAPAEPLRRPLVHLLPNYDEHVVAYRDHGPSLDPAARDASIAFSTALAAHFVVRDGLIVGGWRRTLERRRVVVTTTLLVPLRADERVALETAAEGYGRFVGLPVALVEGGGGP